MTAPGGVDADTEAWWSAFAEGTFLLPRCTNCGRASFPPLPSCPHCGQDALGLEPASGKGTVESWVVVHRALDPEFGADVPYTIVAVHLAEGARLFARFLGTEPVHADEPVVVVPFERDGTVVIGCNAT